MMRIRFTIAILSLLASSAFAQRNPTLAIQCESPAANPGEEHAVEPRSAGETARFHQAPNGARRVTKHNLEVGWANGKRLFKDQPPFNEPLDGVSWTYCGYSPALHLHLIGKQDQSLFTGLLMDDESGKTLQGGIAVLFSSDQQFYLAYEQPDGQDGETLKLYKRSGALIWQGYDFIASPDQKTVVVDAENMRNMRWDALNRPQATVYLRNGRSTVVTLMRDANGKLDWLPHITQ